MDLEITEYLRPRGNKVQITLSIPDELEPKVKLIRDKGYWFEGELLRTGEVSFTVSNHDEDFEIELYTPKFDGGVEQLSFPLKILIERAYERLK